MVKNKKAFTLIEVLVSVLIMSGVIIYVLKMHSATAEEINYISNKSKYSLEDSIFLIGRISNLDKKEIDGYENTGRVFSFKNNKTHEIIKKEKRYFRVFKENLQLEGAPPIIINRIILKDKYKSSYFRFTINLPKGNNNDF